MINLIPYNEGVFEFHKAVKDSKRDRQLRDRLTRLDDEIEILFNQYSDLIDQNNIELIEPHGYIGQSKNDLLSLYSYKLKILETLRIALTTIDGRKHNICQMCTISPVKSFDHILPKERYPEYSVNPINLFPSCTTCNGHKGSRWLFQGTRSFLNLYYDTLPNVNYLSVDFEDYPIPVFSINDNNLSQDFYNLLQSHYDKLHLFGRFRESSGEIVDELVSLGKPYVLNHGIDDFRQTVQISADEMRETYGLNYWKSLLKIAVVNHHDFETLL